MEAIISKIIACTTTFNWKGVSAFLFCFVKGKRMRRLTLKMFVELKYVYGSPNNGRTKAAYPKAHVARPENENEKMKK